MSTAENERTWTRAKLEEMLAKGMKEMQDLASEGSVHLGQYYFLQGSILAASYQRSWSDNCHLFQWFLLFSLVAFVLSGIPFLRKAYSYAKTKNRRDTARLKYVFEQDPELTHLFEEDNLGKMYNYATLFGSSLLLILASTIIFITLGHDFLCDKKQVDFQKVVMINNPIIRFNNDGGCFSACNDQNECLKMCAN